MATAEADGYVADFISIIPMRAREHPAQSYPRSVNRAY